MTQSAPNPEELLLIGVVTSPFGLRGQMKVHAYTNQVEHFCKHIRQVYLGKKRQLYRLESAFMHKPGLLIMELAGVQTREAVDDLRGSEVSILERDAAPLAEGEYFIHQLYGLLVLTEDGQEIGRVHDVLETGASEILVIKRPDQPDALVPMVRDFVQTLDIAGGRVIVRPIEGLL